MKKIILMVVVVLVLMPYYLMASESNNRTSKDVADCEEGCEKKIYAKAIGKTFTANPNNLINKFLGEPKVFTSNKFSVRKPEKFTIVSIVYDKTLRNRLWRIRFASGKIAYTTTAAMESGIGGRAGYEFFRNLELEEYNCTLRCK
jgi:hypothetical protein